jgi:hypothetical protein
VSAERRALETGTDVAPAVVEAANDNDVGRSTTWLHDFAQILIWL